MSTLRDNLRPCSWRVNTGNIANDEIKEIQNSWCQYVYEGGKFLKYYRSLKKNEENEWIWAILQNITEHIVTSKRRLKGPPMKFGQYDIRLMPNGNLTQYFIKTEASDDMNDDQLVENQWSNDERTNDITNWNEGHEYDANRKDSKTKYLQECIIEESHKDIGLKKIGSNKIIGAFAWGAKSSS